MVLDVLVVGGGPTGLAAALALSRLGVSVRVIDKRTAPEIGQRGGGIQPRTIEYHHILGTLPNFLDRARDTLPMYVYGPDGRTPVRVSEVMPIRKPSPDIPWPNCLLLWQSSHEEILRDHLLKHGVKVEWGTELTSFEQNEDVVTSQVSDITAGIEVITSQFLIGAEGSRSIVRKGLELSFLGEATVERVLAGHIEIKNLSRDKMHAWGTPQKLFIFLVPHLDPKGLETSFAITGLGASVDGNKFTGDRDQFVSDFQELTGRTDIEIGKVYWTSLFSPHIRMVDRFSRGRCFLAGGRAANTRADGRFPDIFYLDAAHVHSPTGAQGLNSGFQDSINLAWKLAAVIKGDAPHSLLETYSDERLSVIGAMLNKIKVIHKATFKDNVQDQSSGAWRNGEELFMLGINYRASLLVLDTIHQTANLSSFDPYHGGQLLYAGDRAPEAPGLVYPSGQETSLFEIFSYSHHTLLIFVDKIGKATTVANWAAGSKHIRPVIVLPQGSSPSEPPAGALAAEDREGHAYKTYLSDEAVDKIVMVAVRPDLHIGAMVREIDDLKIYFRRLLVGLNA